MLTIKSQSVIYLGLELSITLLSMLFPDGVPCCNNNENNSFDRTYMILAQTHIINNTNINMMMITLNTNTNNSNTNNNNGNSNCYNNMTMTITTIIIIILIIITIITMIVTII